jgi:hypothetical protein
LFRFNIETGSFGVSKQPKQQQIFLNINLFNSPHHKFCFGCFYIYRSETSKQTEKKKFVGFAKKQTEKQPKQIEFRFEPRNKINGFDDPLIENIFWRFFWFVSMKFCLFRLFRYRSETPKQTETNRNKPKKMFFGFAKQIEKQPKQIEF